MSFKGFKITYTKGSGPGGQHKNKVETCVEIIHLESGMKERCQDTRSRARNEKMAMERLEARIDGARADAEARERNLHRQEQIKDKKTLRTYNFARSEVVDHRTGKRANLKKVLDGNIDLLK